MPVTPPCAARRDRGCPAACARSAGCRMPLISDDLPAPDTPVTATSTPSGNATSMFLRLCSRAPLTVMNPCRLAARRAGTSIRSAPARNCPVSDAGFALQLRRACPAATTRPPEAPGARPEVDDVVGRLDRLRVVLDDDHAVAEVAQPAQRRDQPQVVALVQADATARRARTSRPTAREPSCDARRMRCASPPDSVAAARSSVRYSSPTSSRKPSRAFTSFRISLGDLRARALEPQRSRSGVVRLARRSSRVTSTMLLPASSTARDSGRRRWPLHARHSCSRKYLPYHCAHHLGRWSPACAS